MLVSYLRPANVDQARHAWAILVLLVKRLREAWPQARIVFRAESGFCRWRMLRWCGRKGVGYMLGLAKNRRVRFLLSSAHPYQHLFLLVAARLKPG